MESYGGQLHEPDAALQPGYDEEFILSPEERNAYMRDRYFGARLIQNSDPIRYGSLKTEVSNDFSKNLDEYPTSLTNAHKLVLAYTANQKTAATNNETQRNNSTEQSPGRSGSLSGRITNV